MDLANIDALATERERLIAGFALEYQYKASDMALLRKSLSSLVWVTRDMAELAFAAAQNLPGEFVPAPADFGILTTPMLIGLAGDRFLDNIWMVEITDEGVLWGAIEAGAVMDSIMYRYTWRWDSMIDDPHGPYIHESEGWRAFWALILLANQKISCSYRERPSRRSRRRSPEIEDVVIVTLRRTRPRLQRDEEGGPVNWSHRWLVRGHWANQWYPSIGRHIPLFRHDYVKGPEDAPLVIKDRVFRLSR